MSVERVMLFESVKGFIDYCSDITTTDEEENVISRGVAIIDSENESVDFELDEKLGVIRLNINHEPVLEITKDSPVLEVFKELFYQISDL